MKITLPIMEQVLAPLAKTDLAPLGLTAAASETETAIQKNICALWTATVIISNEGTAFDLTGWDSWFTTRFWIFTTKCFVVITFFRHEKIKKIKIWEDKNHWNCQWICAIEILILSMLFTIELTNFFKKSYFRISKKHDQISIHLANAFEFID